MKRFSRSLLIISLAGMCSFAVHAADKTHSQMPKILQVTREFIKPGKNGEAHMKTESMFVDAMAKAKWPTHYLAVTSLTGKMRALFLTQYDSFEAWEKDNHAVDKNKDLTAELNNAIMADGEMLDSVDQAVLIENEEMSLRSMKDISHMRYLQISGYNVRPGHMKEWKELVKMIKDGYEKADPTAHWGMYNLRFGGEGGTYLVLTARKSLSEFDSDFMKSSKLDEVLGEAGMKRADELAAACIESSEHQLFAFSPRMSYAADAWIKADPEYWTPKKN